MLRAGIGYAIACVTVPMLWGLLVVWVSDRIERRVLKSGLEQGKTAKEATLPPIDYHI